MRNITLFPVLVILFFSIPAYADDNAGNKSIYAFSITPYTGILWGQGEEIVYHENPPRNNSKYKSQLLWDYKPLLYLGLDLGFGPRSSWANSGFNVSLGLKYGLPLKTGVIEDRDWLSDTEDYLTHYSKHDAFSRSSLDELFEGYGSFMANLSFGYSWAFIDRLWLGLYGELSFSRFSWKSRDGYIQYAPANSPWNPALPKTYLSEPAINYSQNWIIFAPGLSMGFKLNDFSAFSVFGAVTPLIIGICRDDHLAIDTIFLDYLYFGLSVRAGSKTQLTFNDTISMLLSFSIVYLNGARGDNYTSEGGGPYQRYRNEVGGGFCFYDLSLGVRISF
jgi:hypothetical protein